MDSDYKAHAWTTSELRIEADELIEHLLTGLREALGNVDGRVAMPTDPDAALAVLSRSLPERGSGSAKTIEQLLDLQLRAGTNTAGPRCLHFVIGGNTPAAHGADLLAAAFDVITYSWVVSPVGVRMELQALDWLKELLGLPATMAGVMVTGATMANFTCLSAARQWWGEQHGFDVSEDGLAGKSQFPVLTSGYVHAATRKVLGLLGIGRRHIQEFSADATGRIDLDAYAKALDALSGAPALVIVNAGEVNAGDFDPLEDMLRLARQHNCWVHVDGAFGLFAAVSPRTAHLVKGVDGADSVTVDGHKWLNVPYDSGYAFVREHGLLARAFRYSADYLPSEDDPYPTPGAIGPESSRRGRSFAVWATLNAYGREGHRRIVEHCLDLARHLTERVRAEADFDLMAEVKLNIVPFRYNPGGMSDTELDRLNADLGKAIIRDGRFLVGTSKLGERTIFRPAFSNWRTRVEDADALLEVIRELAREAI